MRLWGPRAVEVVGAAWRPRRGAGFEASEVGRPRLGLIGAGLGDEVVATLISRAPPRVELHGHGGSAALTLVLDALVAAGATVRPPSDWVRDEAGTALETAALVELARAPTARVAEFLLDQSLGALRRALDATAELCAGGPDELAAARARLTRLIAVGRVGARMVAGARAAILGRPNVGKSSLLNALVGYERAIVDQAAGTTRDVVSARAALDGLPVEFVDTAGLRAARDDVEAAGVAAA
ncbi:MAG: 50S ribosome-binding GTPase, partial [Planctomycetota bacterium]|nr:50S ribosome-binding GTPase [Planctomycetota bacterium]